MKKRSLIIAFLVILIDQLSKFIASHFLTLNSSLKIINNFFYLTLCHNEGAAFGLFKNNSWVIIIGTLVAILFIGYFFISFKDNLRNAISFGLLIGGLFGNLIDRVLFGYVRDFLDFYIFKYDYPIFNIADMGIVIGILLLVIAILKGEDKNEVSRRK